jgi:hypothetical protein
MIRLAFQLSVTSAWAAATAFMLAAGMGAFYHGVWLEEYLTQGRPEKARD